MAELGSAQVKYEMELGAHRQTLLELLAAKDALIERLEKTIRDRETTIDELSTRLDSLSPMGDESPPTDP